MRNCQDQHKQQIVANVSIHPTCILRVPVDVETLLTFETCICNGDQTAQWDLPNELREFDNSVQILGQAK